MTETLSNRLRLAEWQIKSKLAIEFKDTTIDKFELIKEWDFTQIDFPTLEKDFRFTPPWGDMVNKDQNCKFVKENVKMTSEGLSFITTKVNDEKVPYRVGGITTKKDTDIPPAKEQYKNGGFYIDPNLEYITIPIIEKL